MAFENMLLTPKRYLRPKDYVLTNCNLFFCKNPNMDVPFKITKHFIKHNLCLTHFSLFRIFKDKSDYVKHIVFNNFYHVDF